MSNTYKDNLKKMRNKNGNRNANVRKAPMGEGNLGTDSLMDLAWNGAYRRLNK